MMHMVTWWYQCDAPLQFVQPLKLDGAVNYIEPVHKMTVTTQQ